MRCAWVALFAFAPACGGPVSECGDTSSCVSPYAYVDACARDPRKLDGEFVGGVEDCSVDFAAHELLPSRRTIRVTNPGVLPVFYDVLLVEDGDDFRVMSLTSSKVEAGFTNEVIIEMRNGDGQRNATAILESNAVNTAQGDGVITIDLVTDRKQE